MKILLLIFFLVAVFMPVAVHKTKLSVIDHFYTKMLCSSMFLLCGILSALAGGALTVYALCILFALLFGFLGDFLLSYKNEKYFLIGVLCFAIGHLIYAMTFLLQGDTRALSFIVPIMLVTAAVVLFLYFFTASKLDLKKLRFPLLGYSAILFMSFACAVVRGVYDALNGNVYFGVCLIIAAVLFFFSDILLGLGIGGIKIPKLLRHGVSYTYFPAQCIFALSIFFSVVR